VRVRGHGYEGGLAILRDFVRPLKAEFVYLVRGSSPMTITHATVKGGTVSTTVELP
jgi:hypothetical protein